MLRMCPSVSQPVRNLWDTFSLSALCFRNDDYITRDAQTHSHTHTRAIDDEYKCTRKISRCWFSFYLIWLLVFDENSVFLENLVCLNELCEMELTIGSLYIDARTDFNETIHLRCCNLLWIFFREILCCGSFQLAWLRFVAILSEWSSADLLCYASRSDLFLLLLLLLFGLNKPNTQCNQTHYEFLISVVFFLLFSFRNFPLDSCIRFFTLEFDYSHIHDQRSRQKSTK